MANTNSLTTLTELVTQPQRNLSKKDSEPTSVELNSKNLLPTIFDIKIDDRYRILKLIEELLDTQDEADKLRHTLEDEKREFKEKRGALMKKLDQLSEKHEKAVSDLKILKEKYSTNLQSLEAKISTVSDKLEASAIEIKELRKANQALARENEMLKFVNEKSTNATFPSRAEISNANFMMGNQKESEKIFKPKIDRGNSETLSIVDKHTSQDTISSKNELSIANYADSHSGASGDCIPCTTFSDSTQNIKAPTIVIFDNHLKSKLSRVAARNVTSCPDSQDTFVDYNGNFEDTALLESIFFRF